MTTIFIQEEYVDFECADPECPEKRHSGMAILIRSPRGKSMMMQDLNWTPLEAVAAFIEHMGEDVVIHEGEL